MDALPNLVAPRDGLGDLFDSKEDLRKLLIEERTRYEPHTTNFQTDKAERMTLQKEYTGSQNELQRLLHEKLTVQDKFQVLLAEFGEELLDNTREVEDLKTWFITPQKLELLKAQIQHDLERPLRKRFRKLDEEVEKYHTEYNKLRYEHNFLQSEFEHQKEERAHILEESKLKYESESELITPQKLELLKAQIQHDLKTPMRERFWKLEEKVEEYRTEYKKLRYEHNFLKTEFQHQKEEHARILEESKLKCEPEIASLEKDKEDLHNQLLGVVPSRNNKQVDPVLREKTQLVQKLMGLEAGATELRTQGENSGMQAENVQRIQVHQLSEMQAAVRSLEAEKQSVKLQLERVEKELLLSNEQNAVLTNKLLKAEREISALTTEVEEVKHSNKLEIADIKLEVAHVRCDIERERNELQIKIDELYSDNEILKTMLEHLKVLLVKENCELVGQVQAAKEAGFQNLATFQEEKIELETKLAEMEKNKMEQDCDRQLEKDQYEKKITALQLTESIRREMQNIRRNHQQQFINSEESEKERNGNTNLKQYIQALQLSIASHSKSENELPDFNLKFREILEKFKTACQNASRQAERALEDECRMLGRETSSHSAC